MKVLSLFFVILSFALHGGELVSLDNDMPKLPNESSAFRGKILIPDYDGHTWVSYPHVENPASLDQDPQGRLMVAEAHRFHHGTPDLRSNRHMIQDDFKALTIEDRMSTYRKHFDKKGLDWYTQFSEKLVLLSDHDGNGVADSRSLYSDAFNEPLDGIGFSVLAEDNATYFTCIPALRKLTDTNDDGVADTNEKIVTGFGVRISFTGHDLHGIIRGPDGRLYFSVGDRGYHVTDQDGVTVEGSGRGAVFRCDSGGENFEVYAMGLRNPQELAFDDFGNLFTFDNNGDIGDKSRIVYVLDNTDSGWDMSHQSVHQYVNDLDWGDFHVSQSVWVGEKMYETFNSVGPQWVYPPVGHAGEGPSGVTWLSGQTVPENIRSSFLLTDYRGAATKSRTLSIRVKELGAGFELDGIVPVVEGLAASDVEHGYEGNLYFADYGGGWQVNKNGSIQVLRPVNDDSKRVGAETARMIAKGFGSRSLAELARLLNHDDQRVRQFSQFELVSRGGDAIPIFEKILDEEEFTLAALHSIWGLGQLFRAGELQSELILLQSLSSEHDKLRGNAARVIGDVGITSAKKLLIMAMSDSSPIVKSLSAIALGRICEVGDKEATHSILQAAVLNRGDDFDPTLRHSYLSGLSRICTPEMLAPLAHSDHFEQRLLAVLVLRRLSHDSLSLFLEDPDQTIRHETIRAIYDTSAFETAAGPKLISTDVSGLPFYLQARIVGACFRKGSVEAARKLIEIASNLKIESEVRSFALRGLSRWSNPPQFDPVLGHFRPMEKSEILLPEVASALKDSYLDFIENEKDSKLVSFGTEVAGVLGIKLDADILRQQAKDEELTVSIRLASLESLSELSNPKDDVLFKSLLVDPSEEIRAFSLIQAFTRNFENSEKLAFKAVSEESPVVAREAMKMLGRTNPEWLVDTWQNRELNLRSELWLDLYLVLSSIEHAESKQVAATYAAGDPGRVHALSLNGGDPLSGENVFKNQGACLQCHKVDGQGGIQGPDLNLVGDRLDVNKLLESLVNPSAEISPGYGLSNIELNTGSSLVGRIAVEDDDKMVVITPDGKNHELDRQEVAMISPPISAMPALGLTLSPVDLRDLISYLGSRNKKTLALKRKALKHGNK